MKVDVLVIGSGFAGSITAWILASQGLTVAIVDPANHPRFAIGESSTPIADSLLRHLGLRYGLPSLVSLSTFGTWQRDHRELACGRKRGFAYAVHRHGEPFSESHRGERSLLVTASANDQVADTHWYRPEVDQFLLERAVSAGAIDGSGLRVESLETITGIHHIGCGGKTFQADWIIDASGRSAVSAKLAGLRDRSGELATRTQSRFGHFHGVRRWTDWLSEHGFDVDQDPFDADDSAQHHLLIRDGQSDGWVWMLRMNNGITSVGHTMRTDDSTQAFAPELDPWRMYPSLSTLFEGSTCVAPQHANSGHAMRTTGRLQRWFDPIAGPRMILLPTAALTLDPLHSTGIAHALAGVDRVCDMILRNEVRHDDYTQRFEAETRLLDRLVSTAYAVMDDFPRFTAASMLYFAGAIVCEEAYGRGETPPGLWNSDDPEFVAMVDGACDALWDRDCVDFESVIRDRLSPWNTADLMNDRNANRYAYTATKT